MILLSDDAKDTWKSLYANASASSAFSDDRYLWELDDKVLILVVWDKYIEHFIPKDREYWVIFPDGNPRYPVLSKKFVEDIGILSEGALGHLATLCPQLVVNSRGMKLTYLATEEAAGEVIDREILTNMAEIINGK